MTTDANTEDDDLLERLVTFLERFVVFPSPAQPFALGLWVLHTHALEASDATIYPLLLSPEKRSGKSLLLEVLELLVARPWLAISPTEATLFRKIDAQQPALLLDEIDAFFGVPGERTEPMRAVINSGYRRGAKVPRCFRQGNNWAVADFEVFCPKALAGIDKGTLPDTVRDRGFEIRLHRKAGEPVERFRRRRVKPAADQLQAQAAEWAEGAIGGLATAEPELPEELNDRAAEGWEPLLAIADLLGPDTGEQARNAALELSAGVDVGEESHGIQVLADIRRVFEESALASVELCRRLQDLDEAPWSAWGKTRPEPGLTQRDLSRLLKPFGVRSKTVRPSGAGLTTPTAKGYQREAFEEAWRRYLPSAATPTVAPGASGPPTGPQVDPGHPSTATANGPAKDSVVEPETWRAEL